MSKKVVTQHSKEDVKAYFKAQDPKIKSEGGRLTFAIKPNVTEFKSDYYATEDHFFPDPTSESRAEAHNEDLRNNTAEIKGHEPEKAKPSDKLSSEVSNIVSSLKSTTGTPPGPEESPNTKSFVGKVTVAQDKGGR